MDLADGEILEKLVVGEPPPAPHQRVVEIGAAAAAEAGEPHPGEDPR
jgi:hypothetical protein